MKSPVASLIVGGFALLAGEDEGLDVGGVDEGGEERTGDRRYNHRVRYEDGLRIVFS